MDKEQIKNTSAKVDVSPAEIRKQKKAEKQDFIMTEKGNLW